MTVLLSPLKLSREDSGVALCRLMSEMSVSSTAEEGSGLERPIPAHDQEEGFGVGGGGGEGGRVEEGGGEVGGDDRVFLKRGL